MTNPRTFDDDFVRLVFDGGVKNITCHSLGVTWPPPEELVFMGFTLVRQRYSTITDAQREGMMNVCRGAEYFVKKST